ncbi:cyclase [Aeromicrobium sp. 636]|uniref:SRPBCC family protein n=1 Tax=Aeromicrobium senzhongii TaxID=2663859 RepID=A0A8I0ESZ7_9ACTN|nr:MULTISPECIES: SRPBCC family protein [Aeromicrobium]MBC9225464.1 SRPBCC family protein [Aeromicrobium senzhongii]MCQ3997574.1 cyclase [Aeromicrobium sp. 636]MTB87500.1 cyclase [Aeromicrobium senzhongii]QNL95455.1 SRPBCC family protein [Aeromicrobium senzhongii]
MARTVSDIVIDAPPSAVMSVISAFGAYPDWATGMREVTVLERDHEGRPRDVRFVVDSAPIRDTFTLRYDWRGERLVTWSLVPQDETMLSAMDGSYTLDAVAGGRTRVTYQLAVELRLPLLGMLRRKAEKVIVDTALKGLKQRVESRTGV